MTNPDLLIFIDIILRFVAFFGFAFILFILLYYKKNSYIFDPYLLLSMFMGLITFFIYILDIIFFILYHSDSIRIVMHTLSYGFFTLFYYWWYRHNSAIYETGVSNFLHNIIFTLVAGQWIMIFFFFLSNYVLMGILSEVFIFPASAIVTMLSHPSWTVGVIVFGYSTWVAYHVHAYTGKTSTKMNVIISAILLSVMIFSELSNILITFALISANTAYEQLLIGLSVFVLALFMIIFNYLSNDEHIFYLPFTISDILIYSNDGVPIYSKEFDLGQGIDRKLPLVSSFFSAISILFQESLGTDAKLNTISLSGYEIFFLPLKENATTLTVIATRGNYFLIQGMLRFKAMLPDELLDIMDRHIIEHTSDFENRITELLQISMPFILFD